MMSTLGLWPRQRSNLLLFMNIGYFSLFMILEYLDLFLFINNLEHVVMNLTENVTYSQIFVRITMLRVHNDQLGRLIDETTKDFDAKNYKTVEERNAFLAYNSRSRIFVKLLVTFVALTASSYYLTPLLSQLENGLPGTSMSENDSETVYVLPYRIHLFYPVENTRTYVLTYAVLVPFVFVSGFGQTATDCIMVTLVFHICGQMSVLAIRIGNLDVHSRKCSSEIASVIRMHSRLMRMGKSVQEAFSVMLLAYLLSATSLVCILGYQILTNIANGEMVVLVTFLTFQFLVLLVLYAECTVGENLLTESANVCAAFYNCKWYDMPIENARCIILCIARSQNPLCLTAGKFQMFCLSTFTDVLKTSMGYLSVLCSLL